MKISGAVWMRGVMECTHPEIRYTEMFLVSGMVRIWLCPECGYYLYADAPGGQNAVDRLRP